MILKKSGMKINSILITFSILAIKNSDKNVIEIVLLKDKKKLYFDFIELEVKNV